MATINNNQFLSFQDWFNVVDNLCYENYFLSYRDFPDLLMIRDAYESGMTAEQFFDEDVVPMISDEMSDISEMADFMGWDYD
jgi:hypothetical protein